MTRRTDFPAGIPEYEAAIRIEPKDYETLHNWGTALMDQAEAKSGLEADGLYEQAESKLREAYLFSSEMSGYVLATLFALQGRQEDCRQVLTELFECGDLAGT